MWVADGWKDYELLDCGSGEKLERWGKQVLVRPDPQAIWESPRKDRRWRSPDGRYFRSATGSMPSARSVSIQWMEQGAQQQCRRTFSIGDLAEVFFTILSATSSFFNAERTEKAEKSRKIRQIC